MKSQGPILQVLICTYGLDGLQRIAVGEHPATDGVEYLVSWQTGGADEADIPKELDRPDMKIYPTDSKGLSVNRNHALSLASAPLLLIGDDDVDYTSEGLMKVMEAFDRHPDCDLLAFRFRSDSYPRNYPDEECSIMPLPKGYYICSIEIAFRRGAVQDKIRFNEYFGIGAIFPSGEEIVFLKDCQDAGLRGIFIPEVIERHEGTTTSDRNKMSETRPMTQGATFVRLHPRTWPLRMIVHAMREIPVWLRKEAPSPLSFIANWMRGVAMAKKMGVFTCKNGVSR